MAKKKKKRKKLILHVNIYSLQIIFKHMSCVHLQTLYDFSVVVISQQVIWDLDDGGGKKKEGKKKKKERRRRRKRSPPFPVTVKVA